MINTTICEIDVKTRSVYVPPNLKAIGVQSDDEVVYRDFRVAKITPEGVDLSEYSLKVNYLDASGNGYVSPITTTTVSDDYINFRWVISRNATQFKGNVKAVVCFRKVNATTNAVENEWNSSICRFEVLEGVPVESDWQPTQEITDAVAAVISACEQAAAAANASKDACDDAVEALPTTIQDMFAELGLALIDGKLCTQVVRTDDLNADAPDINVEQDDSLGDEQ